MQNSVVLQYEEWIVDKMLDRPDRNGNNGIDYLKSKNIIFTKSGYSYQIAKEGFWCKNPMLPRQNVIFMRIELPFIIPSTYEPNATNGYLAVLDHSTVFDSNAYHFTEPQDFRWVEKFFNSEKRKNRVCIMTSDMDPKGQEWEKIQQRSFRREIIKFFSEKMGEDFHFYGNGWHCGGNSRKGYVAPYEKKHEVLSWYQFNFAVEGESYDGYISEKIFQAMASGCVPIYSGPKDIKKYIPDNVYIGCMDKDLDRILKIVQEMTDDEIENYRKNIKDFLDSEKSDLFSSITFAKTIEKIFIEKGILKC